VTTSSAPTAPSVPVTTSVAPNPAGSAGVVSRTEPAGGWGRLLAVVPGVIGMSLVGGSAAISRTLVTAPLFTAQAIRYAAAALVLLVMVRLTRARPGGGVRLVWPRGREWLWLGGLAATGLVLFNVALVRGVAHAEPAVIAVAVACVPVLLGVLGPVLERQAPARRILVAAAVVTAGGVLVEGTGRTGAVGVAWAAVALGCEAAFTLLAVPVLRRHGPWGVSVHSVWLGTVMFAVLGLVFEGPGAALRLTATDWLAMAYLAVMVTAVAFVLWYSTVAALGAGRVGLLTGVAPISAALLGMATGGGVPGWTVWAGIATVLYGLSVGLRSPRSRRSSPPAGTTRSAAPARAAVEVG
jgi:drug/metabolite transporter (DMT)-like permease